MKWLDEIGPWGMSWHEWLACIVAAPSGGLGWKLILEALFKQQPGGWAGMLLMMFALFLRSAVLVHDHNERR